MLRIYMILFVLMAGLHAQAGYEIYLVNGKDTSKIDAVRALINNPKAKVVRCQEVQLKENKASIGFKVKKDK